MKNDNQHTQGDNRLHRDEKSPVNHVTGNDNQENPPVKDAQNGEFISHKGNNEENQENDADLTADDLLALGSDELHSDLGDDEELKQRVYPVDFSGDELDVPGSEMDDEAEMTGSEDEENNYYSLGNDRYDPEADDNEDS